jgi:hypothetical protein
MAGRPDDTKDVNQSGDRYHRNGAPAMLSSRLKGDAIAAAREQLERKRAERVAKLLADERNPKASGGWAGVRATQDVIAALSGGTM